MNIGTETSRADLERRLGAYAMQARACQATERGRLGRWPVYAAAVGSSLALTTAAEADIIYSGKQDISVRATYRVGTSVKPFPMNPPGPPDQFNLVGVERTFFATNVRAVGLSNLTAHAAMLTNGSGFLKRLHSGAVISSKAGVFATGRRAAYEHIHYRFSTFRNFGTWQPGETSFAGVRFQLGGQTQYGWIRLQILDPDNPLTPVFPEKFVLNTAIDWAYNNAPNGSIKAGQETGSTTKVPEPGSLALALLAAGYAGVLAWRKGRAAGSPDGPAAP